MFFRMVLMRIVVVLLNIRSSPKQMVRALLWLSLVFTRAKFLSFESGRHPLSTFQHKKTESLFQTNLFNTINMSLYLPSTSF
jgi:hypothetical protein